MSTKWPCTLTLEAQQRYFSYRVILIAIASQNSSTFVSQMALQRYNVNFFWPDFWLNFGECECWEVNFWRVNFRGGLFCWKNRMKIRSKNSGVQNSGVQYSFGRIRPQNSGSGGANRGNQLGPSEHPKKFKVAQKRLKADFGGPPPPSDLKVTPKVTST